MKIEIGESLALSWLRHVKNCQVVQLNWKPSTSSWERYNEEETERLMAKADDYFAGKYQLNIFKNNRSSSPQNCSMKIDALGVRSRKV